MEVNRLTLLLLSLSLCVCFIVFQYRRVMYMYHDKASETLYYSGRKKKSSDINMTISTNCEMQKMTQNQLKMNAKKPPETHVGLMVPSQQQNIIC